MKKDISIIIRTKNEERWISHCLHAVFGQSLTDFEVVIVDNMSSDKTLEKATQFKIDNIVTCDDYLPGKALNMGIRESGGKFIVCLSGHCIPTNEKWLENLVKNFNEQDVVGVYGRQEPMEFTTNSDKRDLSLVFGLDRKIQIKDNFFHNANSMIRRSAWEKIPFDEKVTNIEDRIWAKNILQKGYKIAYDPLASVYHYHGINQNGNVERCANVVMILDRLHSDYRYKSIDIEKLNIVSIIPVKGEVKYLADKPLLAYTVQRALESKYIKKVIVSTDNPELARITKGLGAEAPFIRDASFSNEHIDLDQVLKHSLDKIEEIKIFPDLIVPLEITFPFRSSGLIDEMIEQLVQKGLDSVIAARRENKAIWKEREKNIIQLDEGLTPRLFKDPTFIELRGVACVTHPEFLREGHAFGEKIGIYELNDSYSHLEVRSKEEFDMASLLVKEWFK